MPRTADQARRDLWRGYGSAWTSVTELLTATAVWGAIGWGLDTAFGTWPILFVIGAVIGHALGIYMLWFRAKKQMAEQIEMRAQGMRGQ